MPANTVEYITIKGFKSFKSVENLKLNPINILIGANGSGKSNFLQVFEFLRANGDERLIEYVIKAGGVENILHHGSKTTRELSLIFGGQVGHREERLVLVPTTADSLFPMNDS